MQNTSALLKKEFQDKYMTSAELEALVWGEMQQKNKNRTSLNRNALNRDIQRGKYPNRFNIFNNYYLWSRDDVLGYFYDPDKIFVDKAEQFLTEFNEKYILVHEICKKLRTHRASVFSANANNNLPNGFQIPTSNYWVWVRKDIEPKLRSWNKSLKKKRAKAKSV